MYDERIGRRSGHSDDYPGAYPDYTGAYPDNSSDFSSDFSGDFPRGYGEAGTGRHRAPGPLFSTPLVPPDSAWDPAEELAFMLQDALEEEAHRPRTPAAREEPPVTAAEPGPPPADPEEITADPPPARDGSRGHGHRKVRRRRPLATVRTASQVIAALAAVIASTVSFFGGLVAYDPLRIVAVARMESDVASWWPLLVYGPWLVASLSVLRAALHQRRAVHSWCVVLFFSSVAMLLCVLQAPRTIVDISAAALPGLASLACFQQLVRQITLTRPPRRTAPRHRLHRAASPDAPAEEGGPASSAPLASPPKAASGGTGTAGGTGATGATGAAGTGSSMGAVGAAGTAGAARSPGAPDVAHPARTTQTARATGVPGAPRATGIAQGAGAPRAVGNPAGARTPAAGTTGVSGSARPR
ncbi:hypothetical protein [Streptomyces sp. NPDC004065]|uniref:hypothetical protein n=1 Tax=Streptomyces sp. NPDC004065 TaxID=3364689 RepID=UPI00384A57F4